MRTKQILLAGVLLTGSLTACKTPDAGPTDPDIFQADAATIQTYALSKGLSGTALSSGVFVAITQPSASTVAAAEGLEAEYNYTLYALISGSSSTTAVTDRFIDSTYASKPVYLNLAPSQPVANQVQGITYALVQMHEGDRAVVLVPSFFGLGRGGSADGLIPPNAPLRLNTTLKRLRTEAQQISEYLTVNKLTPTETTASGARIIKTVTNPSGALPSSGQMLAVRYRGQLLRSKSAFDSTGTGTAAFKLGDTVPGFNESLATLRVGEKATVVFPSKAGYGATGRGNIPPYAPLRFDIELVSAQ